MKKDNWIRKPLIVGTLGLMLVNTAAPINVMANKEEIEDIYMYKLGDRDDSILTLKEYLKSLGYIITNETKEDEDLFTDELVKQLESFQEDNNLEVTGELDEISINLIELQASELIDSNESEVIEDEDIVEEQLDTEQDNESLTKNKATTFSIQATTMNSNPTVLKNGMRHESVKSLKADLKTLGFTVPGKGTNLYGKQTEAKVKEFQSYYGLTADGQAGPSTFNKIDNILKSPLQRGKRHKDTQTLKANLKILGFTVPGSGTTLYGKQTEAKVKEFQEKYKLVVNGIVDEVTLKKIDDLVTEKQKPSVLKNGVRHESVKTLKANLKILGFTVPGSGTTLYGKQTEAKVKEFQSYYGLTADGQAGSSTLSKIDNILKSPLQRGKRHKDTQTLKANLKILGFTVPGSGTTLYGKQTEAKVKEFQKKHKLVVNGIADEITLKKINDLVIEKQNPSVLENGMRHEKVKTLKANLKKLGFPVPGSGTTLYGKQTEAKVKEFQKYFGLSVTGKVDNVTDNKINTILKTPLQRGKRHKDTQKLKKDLATIGYTVPGSGTTLYGKETEAQVKKFQKDNKLIVNGIADEVTLKKIAELVKLENNTPNEITEYTNYGLTLEQAANIQLNQSEPQTDKYRSKDAYVSKNYIELTGKAVITGDGVNVRTKPTLNASSVYKLNKNNSVNVIKEVKGDFALNSNVWYEISDNGKLYYVHSNYVNVKDAKAIANVNVRANSNTSSHIYGMLSKNQKVTITGEQSGWYKISYKAWRNPMQSDLIAAMDPSKGDKFQHIRLDALAGATAAQLNKMLQSKGTLHNQGQAFINGAKSAKINEAYLIAHATLETGNGTSKLARGVEVGLNKSGKPTVVTSSNKSSLSQIKKVYNMFGIGAADKDPINLGAVRAYEEGWTSPKKAIEGGAKWVGQQYIYNNYKQNTIYKMRWNPQMKDGAAWKQYATDIDWANKQVGRIKEIYSHIPNPTLHFDIPKYN